MAYYTNILTVNIVGIGLNKLENLYALVYCCRWMWGVIVLKLQL